MTMLAAILDQAISILPSAQFGSFSPPTDAYAPASNSTEDVLTSADNFLSVMFGLITVVASVFFVVNFLTATLSWITSAGDSGKITKARDQMLQSVIGLVIVVASYGLIGLIGTMVGLNLLNPAGALSKALGL